MIRLLSKRELGHTTRAIRNMTSVRRGRSAARELTSRRTGPAHAEVTSNELSDYFEKLTTGPGIWKWMHYFDIYHRHLSKFVGRHIDLVEVGVYSGGSLGLWREYFGSECHVYGVDIEPACRSYAGERVDIIIGDQASSAFWDTFAERVPAFDVFIDDGGHTPEQQMVTLEFVLGRLRPGGVYICEDVHGIDNRFTAFASGLVDELNHFAVVDEDGLQSSASPIQRIVQSIHFYPYVLVIEAHADEIDGLRSERRGTEWQPFYDES